MSRATLLEQVFFDCFHADFRTRLVGGAAEPLYLPANDERDALIYYREDFAASALHEVAHWCIAGEQRRQQEDYGYWYAPDGRDASQQQAFEQVEVLPQAVEWHLALAAAVEFNISADNLDAPGDSRDFALAVSERAIALCREPLPSRAARYRDALVAACGGIARPTADQFRLESAAA